jgi:hypothetical protein
VPVLLPALLTEATSLGAAIAGGVGMGIFDSLAAADRFIQAAWLRSPSRPHRLAMPNLRSYIAPRAAAWNRFQSALLICHFPF